MKGTECRLNLIRFTSLMHQYIDIPEGRDLYRLLISLVELQKLAYADDNKRTQKKYPKGIQPEFHFRHHVHKALSISYQNQNLTQIHVSRAMS